MAFLVLSNEKRLRVAAEDGGIDRLTELPEALRQHILSFLPLKWAACTSILSSHWRDLWAHRWPHHASSIAVPGTNPEDPPPAASGEPDGAALLDRLDDEVRALKGRRFDRLSIAFRPPPHKMPALGLILAAAAISGPEDVDLDLSPPPPSATPRRRRRRRHEALFFTPPIASFRTLYRLRLAGFHLTAPATDFKPMVHLEILTLDSLHITDAAVRRIASTCPSLRRLTLVRCPGVKNLVIPGSALRLEMVVLVQCPKLTEIIVSAPNLHSFRASGPFLTSYCFKSVWAPLGDLYLSCGGPGATLPRSNWVAEFGKISGNVRALTLCNMAMQYIGIMEECNLGEFRIMRTVQELQLLIMTLGDSNLGDVYKFFRFCRFPRMEKLFVELPTHVHDSFIINFMAVAEEEPPNIYFQNLKTIRFNNFKAHSNEMRLARFFIERAINLESMILVMPQKHIEEQSSEDVVCDHFEVLRLLRMQLFFMPKASPEAHIILCEHDGNRISRTHSEIYCKV